MPTGRSTGRAAFNASDQVQFVGAGTYSFAARLGTANRVLKSGLGTQIFTGALDHTGDTTVTGGVLLINGTHVNATNYTVNAGGTLGGTGTITLVTGALVTVNADGVLNPGPAADSPGTLTVIGDMTLDEGAIYHCDIDAGANDKVVVDGTLTLPAEATLMVNLLGGDIPSVVELFAFTEHAGETVLTGWTILDGGKGSVVIDGNRVLLVTPPPGSTFLFR